MSYSGEAHQITPWSKIEDAVWDWLQGDPGYRALGLKLLRVQDGRRLAFDLRQRTIPSDALPAITVDDAVQIETAVNTPWSENHIQDILTMPISIAYETDSEDRSRRSAERALVATLDRINAPAAYRSRMGAPDLIEQYEIQGDAELTAIPDATNSFPLFWVGSFSLRIVTFHRERLAHG